MSDAFCIYQQFNVKNNETINLILAADTSLIMLIWALLKRFKKKWTLYIPIIYLVIHSIDLNLILRDKVYPKSLVLKNKSVYHDQFIYYFLIANVGNFMDIKKTVLLFVPIFFCGYLLQLKQEALESH
jgi:hypothetical protein